ncbi:hypothetical protein F66182_6577 [Fusarium sp. NRRL 66182]|nr:hypothetical protein F66182_6577 [Fusarium sp. NRRL 66182]
MEAAASIIAFVQIASEIGKCVVKTKQIWDQAQDLPEELQALILRLQSYKSIFETMQQHQVPRHESCYALPTYSLVDDNLKASMKALQLLGNSADDLISKLAAKKGLKRRLAAVKIAIGKDNLDRLTNRLNEAIGLLNLSLQAWSMTMTILTPDLIVSQMARTFKPHLENTQLVTHTPLEVEEKEVSQVTSVTQQGQLSTLEARPAKTYTPSKLGRFAWAYTTTSGAWQAYIQWPSWLSSSVFELQSSPTICGWTYNYRMYNIVPYKSDVIQKIQKGDKAGVLELFSKRKASPFDKCEYGKSLLYYAADSKNYDLCQLFLSLGLRDALLEKAETRVQTNPEAVWLKIADLFQSYMNEPETNMVLRLFDYQRECDYGDEYFRIFRQRFIPKFHTGPLIHRLEAFRLASFNCQWPETLVELLTQDHQITNFDVSESSRHGISLVHSAALAFGIRYADQVLPYKRGWAMWHLSPYNDGWCYLVERVASAATLEDVHVVETVQPWDLYHVPAWKGTPLISVIGGALCYISPDISFFYWDVVFQECIQEWVSILKGRGMDLMLYGKQEAVELKQRFRGAFDTDAIEVSRYSIRESMPPNGERLTFRRGERADRKRWNKNHWVPIRLLELEFGPTPSHWRLIWAPEFEWMAYEFWKMIEKESIIMPGSWVED